MPVSKSPFLLAGRNTATTHLNRQNGADRLPSATVLASRAIPATHADVLLHDAPAPRSFGAGPDSEATASSVEMSDGEERMRQESLFEAAKAATYVTGDTSPPDIADNMSDVMEAVAEEDHEAMMSESESATHAPPAAASPMRGPSHRKSSSSTTRGSVLAGPTFDVAPPRAIRVMGAPPLGGMPPDSEMILGVASARIKVVQRTVDDFHAQASGWTLGGPPSSHAKDSSWPGLDPKGERSMVTREAHIMTLSVVPGERGQGLGARLLDLLLEECKRRTAGPRIHLAAGSNTLNESGAQPRAHENAPMRTVLEMHPSNTAAMQLYRSRNFRQVPGSKGVIKHFFRGDQRIPSSVRLKVGGSDGIRMERIDMLGGSP